MVQGFIVCEVCVGGWARGGGWRRFGGESSGLMIFEVGQFAWVYIVA